MNSKIKDISGRKFGRLLAIKVVGSKNGAVWLCKCDCGKETKVRSSALSTGSTQSCGSHRIEAVVKSNFKHGLSKTPEYVAWRAMISRCYNPKNASYKIYSRRGITVCGGWFDSFENFLLDIGKRPNGRMSLDRIDNDMGYNCGRCHECKYRRLSLNCRWATTKVQTRNASYNRVVDIGGIKKCLVEWAEYYGIKTNRIFKREKTGMTIQEAITKPLQKYVKRERIN